VEAPGGSSYKRDGDESGCCEEQRGGSIPPLHTHSPLVASLRAGANLARAAQSSGTVSVSSCGTRPTFHEVIARGIAAALEQAAKPNGHCRQGRLMSSEDIATFEIEVAVFALIPEYHQVKVRALDGRQYAITRHTAGVNLDQLREGQRLLCNVTKNLPRVLSAQILE